MNGYVADTLPRAWDWRGEAACRDDPDAMCPDDADKDGIQAAKQVCARCPVLRQCRTAVEEFEAVHGQTKPYGVGAGLSPDERWLARNPPPVPRKKKALVECGTRAGYKTHQSRKRRANSSYVIQRSRAVAAPRD